MKKFVYSSFIFAMAAMLFASCGTQLSTLSITKRHYKSGYFVEMNRPTQKTEILSKVAKTLVTETAPVTQAALADNVSVIEPERITAGTGTAATSQNKQDISKTLTASAEKQVAPARPTHVFVPNTLKELKNIRAISKRIVSENKGHDNNRNGSLIWTIIVILLVVWLISLLAGGWGLGGLIYILLVIALILLILKLLGLI